ncbi:type II CAAX prenyl endopeptidase Rce1 family protein [Tissierella sp. MB52-C2]
MKEVEYMACFFLGLICAISIYKTGKIWTGIIIHNLNDFGYFSK